MHLEAQAYVLLRTEPRKCLPKDDFDGSEFDAKIFALSTLSSTEEIVKVQKCISAPGSSKLDELTFLHAFQIGYTTHELDQLYCCVPSSIASTLKELVQLVQEQNIKRILSLKTVHAV